MSEWITNRLPTEEDADINGSVYNELGIYTDWTDIACGRAWMPITAPEPYVKPKRWRVTAATGSYTTVATGGYIVYDSTTSSEVADSIPTREAAERIAAIYEEVMP